MDFDQYVVARRGRLVEHAVLLGCAEDEAAAYVDQVLLDQRRAIRRSEDPDPLVREALERALSTHPGRRRWVGPLVVLGLVTVVVAATTALAARPQPRPMPSLFALDSSAAHRLLEAQGYDVAERPATVCEPHGLVVGSDPPAGRPVAGGATVTVRVAVPTAAACVGFNTNRTDAWQFIGFALGGPPPEFARTVTVVVDSWAPWHLDHVAAVDTARWGDLMSTIAEVARTPAPTPSGMPTLSVRTGTVPAALCGVPLPDGTQGRAVLRITIDPRAAGDTAGCPLTIDLYRSSDRAIDGVVVYTPKDLARASRGAS